MESPHPSQPMSAQGPAPQRQVLHEGSPQVWQHSLSQRLAAQHPSAKLEVATVGESDGIEAARDGLRLPDLRPDLRELADCLDDEQGGLSGS